MAKRKEKELKVISRDDTLKGNVNISCVNTNQEQIYNKNWKLEKQFSPNVTVYFDEHDICLRILAPTENQEIKFSSLGNSPMTSACLSLCLDMSV